MNEVWISITEAATRLTDAGFPVDRSTLSRYVQQHSEALATKKSGKFTLVEFGSLVQHRGENIRIEQIAPAPRASGPQAKRFSGSQSDGVARKAQADAELREMDLAVRRRQLTPTSEVDQAGRDAVALMQSSFERAIEAEAATLSVKYGWDERATRLALKQFTRTGLEVFHREMLRKLDAMRRASEAGDDPGDTDDAARAGALQ